MGGGVLFYEIEIEVWHGREGSSMKSKYTNKRFKLLSKEELIKESMREVDSRIINDLNFWYKDCAFDILAAYRKYGVTFWGTARIRNRVTGRSIIVYHVEWSKYYWNLNIHRFVDDKLHV